MTVHQEVKADISVRRVNLNQGFTFAKITAGFQRICDIRAASDNYSNGCR